MPAANPAAGAAFANMPAETIEMYSDDEDEPPVRSANRATEAAGASPPMRCPAPVPLAAMISSDEEEDDDDAPARPVDVPIARTTFEAPAAAPATAGMDMEGGSRRSRRTKLTGSFAHEDEDHAYARPVDRDDEAIEPFNGGDEIDDAGPPPPEPEPVVMAAPGIAADENFAEEDWDDEDM